ncbi:hypothetical protein E2C01_067610 [Portunus trituberculatus]|uniref:Uncharacterized protein n=1 Tax=Portunus trituberculatus TaxID=210409 RepID=A0A5B7HVI7_PORTR|nr:hypothetical protein [Portunus trituberculatus]
MRDFRNCILVGIKEAIYKRTRLLQGAKFNGPDPNCGKDDRHGRKARKRAERRRRRVRGEVTGGRTGALGQENLPAGTLKA